jgi:hypothetical protein
MIKSSELSRRMRNKETVSVLADDIFVDGTEKINKGFVRINKAALGSGPESNDRLKGPQVPNLISSQPGSTLAAGYKPAGSLYDRFLVEFTKTTPILDNSRLIPMSSKQEDVTFFNSDLEFAALRTDVLGGPSQQLQWRNSNASNGATGGPQGVGVNPIPENGNYAFHKKALDAKELVSFYTVPEVFLYENLEGEAFLNTLASEMAKSSHVKLENIMLYSAYVPDSELTVAGAHYGHVPTSYLNSKGIFQQLADMRCKGNNYDLITNPNANPLTELGKLLRTFIKPRPYDPGQNKGSLNNIVGYVPAQLLTYISEQVALRETPVGDNFTMNRLPDGAVQVLGVQLYPSDALENPVNVYEANEDGALPACVPTPLPKILLGQRDNIAYGVFRGLSINSQYNIYDQGYVTALNIAVDALALWPHKSLYADVIIPEPYTDISDCPTPYNTVDGNYPDSEYFNQKAIAPHAPNAPVKKNDTDPYAPGYYADDE